MATKREGSDAELTVKKSNGSGQYPSQNYLHHQIYQHKSKMSDVAVTKGAEKAMRKSK